MKKQFKKMSDRSAVELADYAKSIVEQNPGVEVYVGCDSQNYSSNTVYVSTVLFRYQNRGAHVVYTKENVSKISDLWTRLWAETERSIAVATFLTNDCDVDVKQIDMDYNSDPQFASNKLISAAVGYAESLGFKAKTKPDLLMATWAANVLCH